ncbi:MAG: hypothetical protein HY823_12990 [Acidobacteria bacterium]|nr:hypothetical protein [Acidobacteriota bacterium]
MRNTSLRNSVGLASLSALALVMVACGGSSSSSTPQQTIQAPSAPVIVGPTNAITLHPAFYNLSSVDPQGQAVSFIVNGNAIQGNTYQLNATTAGSTTISAVAKNTSGATSAASTLTVAVAANRPPQFISQASGQLIGTSNTINWTNFQVSAQDPDTDDVQYSVTGTPTFVDNAGAAVTGASVSINATSGAVSFTGTVPSGKTSVTATFTVQAVDKLPGTTVVLGATATQTVSLTYFNGNQPPIITTTSLPNLPTNHYIPLTQGGTGFPVQATDPNGDAITLWAMTTSVPGLVLDATSGNSVNIITNSSFVPQTSLGQITVNITATDARGLSATKPLSIQVVADSKPALNSSPYTETVSGVKFFDKSQVKDQVTGRARFYPSAVDWLTSYSATFYGNGETNHAADAQATDAAFSNVFAGGADQAVAGWTARTLFRDAEGDQISYIVDARSVYVSAPPSLSVGQPFTLIATGGPSDVYPKLWNGWNVGPTWSPLASEFPMIDGGNGTMTWRPAAVQEQANNGPLSTYLSLLAPVDNLGAAVVALPSTWSFTVMGYEKVWNPSTSTYVTITDPSQAGRIDYSIKVQPNNRPKIGALTTIPNAITLVPGAQTNNVFFPNSVVSIGGGATINPTAYGRPSIQEPESRRYDILAGTGFDYSAPNPTPAAWRWLNAMAGGDPTYAADVQIYDPDTVAATNSGHKDATHSSMGTATVPPADTTNNLPVVNSASVAFYNPWSMSGNAGKFEVNWGPNRLQYLIARVTASAAYTFPVEVRDQYERQANRTLGINPIFGTVRFTNARTRMLYDTTSWASALVLRGSFGSSVTNFPGDPVVAASTTYFTLSYLPFLGTGATDETNNVTTFLFSGSGPASGIHAAPTVPAAVAPNGSLYTVGSWITLNSTEQPQTGYHTGNPLNNELNFNVPSYAQGYYGTSGSSTRSDWKPFNYTWVNGQNPSNPTAADNYALYDYANREMRGHVIPSNSPYLFAINQGWFTYGYSGYGNKFPTGLQGSTLEIERRVDWAPVFGPNPAWGNSGYWYDIAPTARGWYYNLYQGEVDVQNASPGHAVSLPDPYDNTSLRWTYSWPTQITQSNFQIASLGGPNVWQKGDVMQVAVPGQSTNGRYFFVGDGSNSDPQRANIFGWGMNGMSSTGGTLTDTDLVFGTSTSTFNGLIMATNTPFHVPSDSLWIWSNWNGAPTSNMLNMPNRTTFSPGASASQLPYATATKGYIHNQVAGSFMFTDPGLLAVYPQGNADAALVQLGGDPMVYFSWMRQDPTYPTAWGTWDASMMVPGSTYTATGGQTVVPAFSMAKNVANSTLPASYGTDAQISMATGNLPGQNHASNIDVSTDASLYNSNILSAQGWARSQWGLAAPTMGYQPSGTNNARLVNPAFDGTVVPAPGIKAWDNLTTNFKTLVPANVSTDGGVRDSAIVYAVRKHNDEKGNSLAELGLAGIQPSDPMIMQWYNLQNASDVPLDASTIASTNMVDVSAAGDWPVAFTCYSPFVGNNEYAHVMEFKVNYLVGMVYPDANVAAPTTETLAKVPAVMANVFPLGAPVTDPSCTNPGNTVNPGNPIVRPIQFLRVSDYVANTAPGVLKSTLDLVNSNPSNSSTGAGALNLTAGGNTYIQARSNLRLTWQASVNNQVLPSGYIFEIYQLTGTATTTNQPVLVATVRVGHLGGRDAIQKMYLPSMHSFTGLDGIAAPNTAVYFFRVRTVWHKGINFEKQPTKQSIPMAYADYVSAPFVTN